MPQVIACSEILHRRLNVVLGGVRDSPPRAAEAGPNWEKFHVKQPLVLDFSPASPLRGLVTPH